MILSYCRVSTAEQAADGTTSLREQERKNRAIATLRQAARFDFCNYEDAGVSGSIPLNERPAGKEMLAAAKKGDCIVANKMDRLFRSATDALQTADQLKKRGVDLILIDMGVEPVTGNGVSRMFFGMLSLVAEFERERITERMAGGREAKKELGGHIGGAAPYGFDVVGEGRQAKLIPNREEQDIIALAREIKNTHGMRKPYRVTRALNELGITTRTGKPWHRVQVQRFLDRGPQSASMRVEGQK